MYSSSVRYESSDGRISMFTASVDAGPGSSDSTLAQAAISEQDDGEWCNESVRARCSVFAALSVVVCTALIMGGGSLAANATGECSATTIRSAVVRFVIAYNRGASPQLDALFAREPDFRWYSAGLPGLRIRSAAYRRDTLLNYFQARYRQHDRLRLLSLRFNGNSGGVGHFEFRFERSALDYRAGRLFRLDGKGAAICSNQKSSCPPT